MLTPTNTTMLSGEHHYRDFRLPNPNIFFPNASFAFRCTAQSSAILLILDPAMIAKATALNDGLFLLAKPPALPLNASPRRRRFAAAEFI